LGFGSGLNLVGAMISSLFRDVRSRLCSGWLLTVRNCSDKTAGRSVQYGKHIESVRMSQPPSMTFTEGILRVGSTQTRLQGTEKSIKTVA
jgi:hypothetical protein